MPAGIVLQAYLPDSHDVLERLGAWAADARRRRRGADQGAHRQGRQPGDGAGRRRAARLGPGAVPDQGRRRRQLQAAARLVPAPGVGRGGPRRRRQPQPVRRRLGADAARRAAGSAARRIEIEMLEGMAPAQSRAVRERAGTLLLYCPVVRDDEFEASIAYLARRLDENTAPENFLRALFTMRPGSAEFAAQAERFRARRRRPARRCRPTAAPADRPSGIAGETARRSSTSPTPTSPIREPARRRRRRPRQARRQRLPRRRVPADRPTSRRSTPSSPRRRRRCRRGRLDAAERAGRVAARGRRRRWTRSDGRRSP